MPTVFLSQHIDRSLEPIASRTSATEKNPELTVIGCSERNIVEDLQSMEKVFS